MTRGFYSMRDLQQLTTLSDATLWRLIADEKFPKPMRLTERRNVWPVEKVDAWIEDKKKAADNAEKVAA